MRSCGNLLYGNDQIKTDGRCVFKYVAKQKNYTETITADIGSARSCPNDSDSDGVDHAMAAIPVPPFGEPTTQIDTASGPDVKGGDGSWTISVPRWSGTGI
jgi:hypothetical protein